MFPIPSKPKEFARPEKFTCKCSLVILFFHFLLSSGMGQSRNKDEFLFEIERIGRKLCAQYKGTLCFATSPSSIPRSRIKDAPLFTPSEAHNFESVCESSKEIVIESCSQLTPLSQPNEPEEGCVDILLYGRCTKEICFASHEQANLEKTCQSLITTLMSSRYNVQEVFTHKESSPFIVDDDIDIKSENISKRKKRKRHNQVSDGNDNQVSDINDNKKREKMIRPPKVDTQERYQQLKTIDDTPVYELIHRPHIDIDESNILTKDTWTKFFSKFSREFDSNQLLMLGAPHQAEVEYIQKCVRLKILEYR